MKYGACLGVICGYLNHNKQIGKNGHVCNNIQYMHLNPKKEVKNKELCRKKPSELSPKKITRRKILRIILTRDMKVGVKMIDFYPHHHPLPPAYPSFIN